MTGYVYAIKNILNGRMYIGETCQSPFDRWKAHLQVAKQSFKNPGKHLLYIDMCIAEDPGAFRFTTLLQCLASQRKIEEGRAINQYDTVRTGYNRKGARHDGRPFGSGSPDKDLYNRGPKKLWLQRWTNDCSFQSRLNDMNICQSFQPAVINT